MEETSDNKTFTYDFISKEILFGKRGLSIPKAELPHPLKYMKGIIN